MVMVVFVTCILVMQLLEVIFEEAMKQKVKNVHFRLECLLFVRHCDVSKFDIAADPLGRACHFLVIIYG